MRTVTTVLPAALAALASPLAGQAVSADMPQRGPLLTRRDLVTVGAAVAAAGALLPFDTRIARWSQQPRFQRSPATRAAAAALRTFGDPGALAAGVVVFGIGAASDRRGTAAVGLHTVEAIVASGAVTGAVKMLAGRARPYTTGDSSATSFDLGRGLRGGTAYQSLPSGHSTAAFALAGALAAEGRHRWASTNRITGPAGFAVAALVAGSRIYHDRHWASDVVLGAGIGATAGAVAVRYARTHPGNAADRRLLPRRSAVPPVISWTARF